MKKRIVFFTEALYGGGVQRILQIILSHFDYSHYDVTLYTVCKNVIRRDLFPKEVTYKYIFDVPNSDDSLLQKLWYKLKNKIKLSVYYHCNSKLYYRLFIREKADIAIAFIEGYATRLVAGFPDKIKKIAWLHTDIINNHWSKVAFRDMLEEQKLYRNSFEKIVCVSKVVLQNLITFAGKVDGACILYNPTDNHFIISQANQNAELLGTHEDGIRLISLGSLIDVKGYDRLLAVVAKLRDEGYRFKLYILGSGNKKRELKSYIRSHNLSSYAFILEFQDNPYPYLKWSDIYVCSSYAEGYNTAITEALVLGKAVVSTECSGVKEQLGEHNEWGICVPNSEEGLYDGLKQMLNPDILDYYTRQASIRGKDFTLEKSMNEIYKLIEG